VETFIYFTLFNHEIITMVQQTRKDVTVCLLKTINTNTTIDPRVTLFLPQQRIELSLYERVFGIDIPDAVEISIDNL